MALSGQSPDGTDRIVVRAETIRTRYLAVDDAGVQAAIGANDIELTLLRKPAVILRAVDAATRHPITDASLVPGTFGARTILVERREGALALFAPPGTFGCDIEAPGFVPRAVVLRAPPRGEVEHPEPVALERGLVLGGRLRAAEAATPVAGSLLVERLDGPGTGARFVHATAGADGAWRAAIRPAGRYRLVALAPRRWPGQETLDLRADEPAREVRLVLRSAPAPVRDALRPWPGDDPDLGFPADLPEGITGLEVVEWLEAVSGARVGREGDADARLAETGITYQATGTSPIDVLVAVASVAGLDLDPERGVLFPRQPGAPTPSERRDGWMQERRRRR
ncbi:MAG: hypothetical protein L0216_15050 [Planctomycetales bacterium]|nr:hypothetical protein [Planctomycetales bacterium]